MIYNRKIKSDENFEKSLKLLIDTARCYNFLDFRRNFKSLYKALYLAYDEIEHFASFDQTMTVEGLLDPDTIDDDLSRLYAMRAMFEYLEEWQLARSAVSSPIAPAMVTSEVDRKVSNLPPDYLAVLNQYERVLFAGSGPLPKTAMAFCEISGLPVTCVDWDPEANEIARQYVEASGRSYDISFLEYDMLQFDRFEDYDVIVGALLLGVDAQPQPLITKTEFIRKFVSLLPSGTDLIVRFPKGLGQLIYPAIDFHELTDRDVQFYPTKNQHLASYNDYFAVIKAPVR